MQTKLIKMETEDDKLIWIEADNLKAAEGELVGGRKKDTITDNLFHSMIETIKSYTKIAYNTLKEIEDIKGPNKISLEFGIKVGVNGTVYIAKGTGEANIKISINWDE